jgi:hypothetical protein
MISRKTGTWKRTPSALKAGRTARQALEECFSKSSTISNHVFTSPRGYIRWLIEERGKLVLDKISCGC